MRFARPLIFLAATALAALVTAYPELFVFTRDAISSGEIWRLYTGHFVHFSSAHFIANVAVLALLLSLLPSLTRWHLAWLGLLTPLLLGASLFFFRPHLATYGGLSGWISAIFVFLALHYSRRPNPIRHLHRTALLLFTAKVAFEATVANSLFADLGPGVMVEPSAHAFGALLGALGLLLDPPPHNLASLAAKIKRRLPKEPPDIFWGCVAQAPDQFAKGNKKE